MEENQFESQGEGIPMNDKPQDKFPPDAHSKTWQVTLTQQLQERFGITVQGSERVADLMADDAQKTWNFLARINQISNVEVDYTKHPASDTTALTVVTVSEGKLTVEDSSYVERYLLGGNDGKTKDE